MKNRVIFFTAFLLLLIGLFSSLYLTKLFYDVQAAAGNPVESFCAINTDLNCVTVASSEYSSFLGIPFAVYGLEFYFLCLALLLFSQISYFPIRAWNSALFLGLVISLPSIFYLAAISYLVIQSFCLLCCLVYLVNISLIVLLSVAYRKEFRQLILAAPTEAISAWKRYLWFRYFILVAAAAFGSQFFWLPQLLSCDAIAAQQQEQCLTQQNLVKGLSIGPENAPIVIEEFSDFHCSCCKESATTLEQIINSYPGQIRLTHRDFPLDSSCNPYLNSSTYSTSCQSAAFARCASEQGLFWPLRLSFYSDGEDQTQHELERLLSQNGADLEKLHRCLKDPNTTHQITKDLEIAKHLNITETPTVIFNGSVIVGNRPFSFWQQMIDQQIRTEPVWMRGPR